MTVGNRLRLVIGLIGVLGLLYGLSVALNYSMSHVSSRTAQLKADTYTIGTDYSGIVVKQYVSEGEHVTAGQPLFLIKSSLLNSDLTSGTINKTELAYNIDNNNQITLEATNAGIISEISYLEGAFVPANKEVATITRDNSLYVEAKYKINPPDYARIKHGDTVTITLPNNARIEASIFDISVENDDNMVQTVVKAWIKDLDNTTFTIGTPVSTELHLNGKSLYDSTKELLQNIIKPRG